MRMWMINPILLCSKHLVGEHGEIHKFHHSFEKMHDMNTRIKLGHIDHTKLKERHDRLAVEIDRRADIRGCGGHKSPYEAPCIDYIDQKPCIDLKANLSDLMARCPACKERIGAMYGILDLLWNNCDYDTYSIWEVLSDHHYFKLKRGPFYE